MRPRGRVRGARSSRLGRGGARRRRTGSTAPCPAAGEGPCSRGAHRRAAAKGLERANAPYKLAVDRRRARARGEEGGWSRDQRGAAATRRELLRRGVALKLREAPPEGAPERGLGGGREDAEEVAGLLEGLSRGREAGGRGRGEECHGPAEIEDLCGARRRFGAEIARNANAGAIQDARLVDVPREDSNAVRLQARHAGFARRALRHSREFLSPAAPLTTR